MATRNTGSSTGMTFKLKHEYRFNEAVHVGPMTTLYRGQWDFFDRDVYLASAEGLLGLKPTSRTVQRVFGTLADEAGRIHGPYLPDIIDSSRVDKITAVVVMRLPPGMILSRYIEEEGPLDADQTYRILRGVARALEQCREQVSPHRGATPDRVWLSDDGRPTLLGYGEALRRSEVNHLSGHTSNEIWWHTPPEVLRDAGDGQREATTRLRTAVGSDQLPTLEDSETAEVWTLGGLAYYCLTGHHPYYAKPNDHQHGIINVLNEVRLPLPDEVSYLQPVIDKALHDDPSSRYLTGSEMASAFYSVTHPGSDEAEVSTGPQKVLPGMPHTPARPSAADNRALQHMQVRGNLWRIATIALTLALLAYAWMDYRRPRSLLLTSNPNGIEIIETTGHLKTPRGRTPIILSDRRLNDPVTLQTVGPSGDLGEAVSVLPSSFVDLGRCLHAEIIPDFEDAATLNIADTSEQDENLNDDAAENTPLEDGMPQDGASKEGLDLSPKDVDPDTADAVDAADAD